MTVKKRIICIILIVLLVIIGSGAVYAYSILHQVSGDQLDESNLSINDMLDGNVLNIALFGIDGRDGVEGDRSDTIMIASLNFQTGTINVTSIMRDTVARIETENGTSYEKINAAYDYGGPQLAVKTLNDNFDLNITDYVVVNFDCLVDTVDALGGVEVNIADESILYWTNQYIMDVNDKTGHSDPFLESTGVQTVTGVQALAFCRNRYSDSDYGRTERQRQVVQQIVEKAMNVDLMTGINLIGKVYPYITTSLTLNEMSSIANQFMTLENKTFNSYRLPTDEKLYETMIGDVWFLFPNSLEENVIELHKLIYGIDTYTPTDNLKEISNHIAAIVANEYDCYVSGGSIILPDYINPDDYAYDPNASIDTSTDPYSSDTSSGTSDSSATSDSYTSDGSSYDNSSGSYDDTYTGDYSGSADSGYTEDSGSYGDTSDGTTTDSDISTEDTSGSDYYY